MQPACSRAAAKFNILSKKSAVAQKAQKIVSKCLAARINSRIMRLPYRCRNCNATQSGNSSVGRAQPCQGWGREFESRFPLQIFKTFQRDASELLRQAETKYAGIAQLVEHNLAKVGVASSSLVSRSNFLRVAACRFLTCISRQKSNMRE